MVWLMNIVDIILAICLNFAYYDVQLARLSLRAKQGRLLSAPTSLFGGCVSARQGT
jgi:hypothetical protein